VGIRGPIGRGFVLEAMRGKDVVLIAGGCGLAPMRALVQYCEDRREEFGEVSLLVGAKTPADMLYKEDLGRWVRSQAIRCRSTVDAVPGGESWQGHVGLVTELIVPLRVDPGRTVAVIVGPPVMYRPVIAALRAKGLADSDIMVSLERHMKCGVGKCGHCAMDHLYCCLDGPVFWFPEIAGVKTAL
jgi:NAD(P)H-flavin reductase